QDSGPSETKEAAVSCPPMPNRAHDTQQSSRTRGRDFKEHVRGSRAVSTTTIAASDSRPPYTAEQSEIEAALLTCGGDPHSAWRWGDVQRCPRGFHRQRRGRPARAVRH